MAETAAKSDPPWELLKPEGFADEHAFVKALQAGSRRAWEEFYRLYDEEIRFFVWRTHSEHPEDLDDIVHGVYAKLPRSLRNFRHQCPLHFFVRKVTMDYCTDDIRRRIKARGLFRPLLHPTEAGQGDELPPGGSGQLDPSQEVARNERNRAVLEVLGRSTAICREVIELRYFRHHAYDDMATHLGLSINTIGSRLRKCMDKMRDELLAYK